MAKRSSRIPEMREENKLSCMWGMFSILESHQGRGSRRLISNAGPPNKHIVDYPRKLDRLASFDEECRKIQLVADLASVTADASETSVRNLIEEDTSIEKHRHKQIIVKGQQHAKMESELVDHLFRTHKTEARHHRQRTAYQSSLCHLNDAACLVHPHPSHPDEISLNKLKIAEILGAVCSQNPEINMQHVQMRAKAFVDQMFIDRKLITKQGANSEYKPFSDALEILSTNKDLFMEFLPGPNRLLTRFIRPVLDAKFSECERNDAPSSEKESMNHHLSEKIDSNCQYSSKTSFKTHPDKIVILKPAPQNIKYSENITCHSSSQQSYQKLSGRVLKTKPASFSFKEIKRKLKHTFGGANKEPNQFPTDGTSHKLAHNISILKVGDCICREVDTKNSLNSSTNVQTKGKLPKKPSLKSSDGPDVVCMTDTVRKKLDFPSVSLSKTQEFDVIFEAKRHLSARVKNRNEIEALTSKTSPKTIGRILSSPEHDFWPISPRRDSQCSSSPSQMRFSPYSNSLTVAKSSCQIPSGRQRICSSPMSPNKEVTSCDDYNINDGTNEILEMKTSSSLIRSSDVQAHDTTISEVSDMNSNGEPKIEEMNCIQKPELSISGVSHELNGSDFTKTIQKTDTIELHEEDGIVLHFVDSLSENDTLASTADDIPSTPMSIYQLDMADRTKYQEEHQSPVSVLEPFFSDEANSPSNIMLQTAERSLQPLRLDFEDCSHEPFSQDPQINANASTNEHCHISHYVHSALQASCLNWDHLSEIRPPPEELLHTSLFEELEFPPMDSHFDPKLLFDHMNEVLLEIYQFHFCFPPWLTFIKPRIMSVLLEEIVLHEIMKEAEFYLLPQTEQRTLNQIVSKDVSNSRWWLDVRHDTEQIAIHVSDYILEESILEILLEFHT